MKWLVAPEVWQQIARAYSAGIENVAEKREAWLGASERFGATVVAGAGEPRVVADAEPRGYVRAGDVAEIRIVGVLTERPDFMLWLFDIQNCLYPDIRAAVALAERDPDVKRVEYYVDSPGGEVKGIWETFEAIKRMTKPRTVRAAMALSGGYGLAAVAARDGAKIIADHDGVPIGSVGAAVSIIVPDDVVDIANRQSPDKRPNVETPEGVAVIQDQLDEVFDLFASYIADGRGVNVKAVVEEFGHGRTFLAKEAKRRGMIDAIAKPGARASSRGVRADGQLATPALEEIPAAPSASNHGEPAGPPEGKPITMNAQELKEKHPEVFAEVKELGVKSERSRCNAHAKMGAKFGAATFAFECIANGASVTDDEVFAEYQCAGKNRQETQARQDDSHAAAAVVEGAASAPAQGRDLGDQVADVVDARKDL